MSCESLQVLFKEETCVSGNSGQEMRKMVIPKDSSVHAVKSCPLCARTIIQAEIRNVILRQGEEPDNYIVVPAAELEWHQ